MPGGFARPCRQSARRRSHLGSAVSANARWTCRRSERYRNWCCCGRHSAGRRAGDVCACETAARGIRGSGSPSCWKGAACSVRAPRWPAGLAVQGVCRGHDREDSCATAARHQNRSAYDTQSDAPASSQALRACCVEGPLSRHRRKRLAGFVGTNRRHPRWPRCPASVRSRDGARARNPRLGLCMVGGAKTPAPSGGGRLVERPRKQSFPAPSAADQLELGEKCVRLHAIVGGRFDEDFVSGWQIELSASAVPCCAP